MELNKAFKKVLSVVQQYCDEHNCKNCKLHTKSLDPYIGCPFRYPRQWKLEEMDFSQLPYGSCDFDRFDLYDYFDKDEDDEEESE